MCLQKISAQDSWFLAGITTEPERTGIDDIKGFLRLYFLPINVGDITCLRSDHFTTVSCISIQIRKARKFAVSPRFLILKSAENACSVGSLLLPSDASRQV